MGEPFFCLSAKSDTLKLVFCVSFLISQWLFLLKTLQSCIGCHYTSWKYLLFPCGFVPLTLIYMSVSFRRSTVFESLHLYFNMTAECLGDNNISSGEWKWLKLLGNKDVLKNIFVNSIHEDTVSGHLCFTQAQPKMCHSPKVDDGVDIFKASALWADAFYKSKCPYVCVCVCVSVHFWGTV